MIKFLLWLKGFLDPPSNITVDFKNQTVIHLSWLPPFSLKDILGYAVVVLMEGSNDIIDESQAILPEFTYSRRATHGYCNRLLFRIAAINGLGLSNKTGQIVTGFLSRCKLIVCTIS